MQNSTYSKTQSAVEAMVSDFNFLTTRSEESISKVLQAPVSQLTDFIALCDRNECALEYCLSSRTTRYLFLQPSLQLMLMSSVIQDQIHFTSATHQRAHYKVIVNRLPGRKRCKNYNFRLTHAVGSHVTAFLLSPLPTSYLLLRFYAYY